MNPERFRVPWWQVTEIMINQFPESDITRKEVNLKWEQKIELKYLIDSSSQLN